MKKLNERDKNTGRCSEKIKRERQTGDVVRKLKRGRDKNRGRCSEKINERTKNRGRCSEKIKKTETKTGGDVVRKIN